MVQAQQNLQFSKENLINLIDELETMKVLPGVLKDKVMTHVLAQPETKQIQIFNMVVEEQRKFEKAEQEYMEKSTKAYQDYLGELKIATQSIARTLNRKVEEYITKTDEKKTDDLLKEL